MSLVDGEGGLRTTSHTGHCIPLTVCVPLCDLFETSPSTSTTTTLSLALIILKMASRSKLCTHFVLVTGSCMGRSVMGHFMLMRSEATSRPSSSLSFGEVSLGLLGFCEVVEGNQVESCGRGGASSPGCRASWTIRLKPM